MASATATATMAAAGFDKRASNASSLQTPGSGGFPSELRSPLAGSPGFLRKDDLKTPITPPSAYLDFLNKISPAMMSPAPTTGGGHFTFGSKPFERSSESASITPPLTAPLPPLSRNTSYDSQTSTTSRTSQQSAASQTSTTSNGPSRSRPTSPRVIIPPAQFVKPGPRSARTPRLRIPQSPFTPALSSAQSIPSPYSSTPVSAAPWSASFSPREPLHPDGSTPSGKVSVRQVVTRTVTYCRTPLDPAPKGKRRKIEVEDLGSKSASEEPQVIKEEDENVGESDEVTPSTAHQRADIVPKDV